MTNANRYITSMDEKTSFLKFSKIKIYKFNSLIINMPTGFLKWNLTILKFIWKKKA